jgi:hypothetical protein
VLHSKQRAIMPTMMLCRSDIADAAVAVLIITSVQEAAGPLPRNSQIGETLLRECRARLAVPDGAVTKAFNHPDA